jgi:hypothetical protein
MTLTKDDVEAQVEALPVTIDEYVAVTYQKKYNP